ncbi:MAG: LCP family protein [Actinobacteria bacterium]|nr:LCP family protein [Actinomycetota bacterium]
MTPAPHGPTRVADDELTEVEDVPATRPSRSDPPRSRRSAGRRSRARRQRRRRALARSSGLVLGAIVLAVGVTFGVGTLVGPPDDEPSTAPDEPAAAGLDPQPTLVLATFDEEAAGRGASLIAVLGFDRTSGQGTVMFVPSTTVADIPGHGLLQIGRAYGFGEGPLLDASLDNLLGVDLDDVVGISRQGWASLFTRVGGLTIEVSERLDERLPDGSSRARFREGEQFLDGPRVAEFLTFQEAGESELEAMPRAQRVILALLDRVAEDPSVLDALFEDGAPMLDTAADPEHVRELLVRLAEAATRDELVVRTLPVSPIGSGTENSFRLDEARASELVEDRFGASRPVTTAGAGRDLQILNGNGVPGIGQRVAERLVPAGYKVVLTRNADRFDHEETRIIVYDDAPEQLAAAEEIRELLGVGRVELSRTPQSVADITVVIGLDFLERGESG